VDEEEEWPQKHKKPRKEEQVDRILFLWLFVVFVAILMFRPEKDSHP
jgi:hypothetical protein